MMRLQIFILICGLGGISLTLGEIAPTVHIKNGTLEGTVMKTRKGRDLLSFRGIPYAQPPVGELRFEPPKPSGSWNGVRSAKEDANICIQRDEFTSYQTITGVEDCLYLNVYTPEPPLNDTDGSKINYPVMIWIHGGGWTSGSSHSGLYGPKFMLDYGVILVTVNYRLGALGFFSTQDLVSPGNQGLKDQTQAIRWVQENIAAFNGDPNRITIFGESAGGTSVHYHMVSPLSRGLFHRAISESGVVLNPFGLNRPENAKNQTIEIGKLLGCPTNESSALVDCLKKKDANEIVTALSPLEKLNSRSNPHIKRILLEGHTFQFRPAVEPDHPGAFIKEEPAKSLKSGRVADVPWIIGTNSHEGALTAAPLYGSTEHDFVKQFDEEFMKFAPYSLLYDDTCPKEFIHNVTKSIRNFYLGEKKIDESTRWNVIDMFTDAYFYIGADNAVRDQLETQSSPIYYYYFAYRGKASLSSLLGDPSRDYGVCHADELQYLFPIREVMYPDKPLNDEELEIVNLMTVLWSNFAKSGNPTPEKTPKIPLKWKPVRTSNLEYLHIGSPRDLRMDDHLHQDRVNFWANLPYHG